MATNAMLVCKAPSLKDTHLSEPQDFRVPILRLSSVTITCTELFHADLCKSHDTSEEKPIYLLSLPTINFAEKVFSDLSAIYVVTTSPSMEKRKEDFLPLSPPDMFWAALPAVALLHAARGCQAQTVLSRGLRDVKEPSP